MHELAKEAEIGALGVVVVGVRVRVLGVVEKYLMKVNVELVLVDHVEEEEIDEKEHDDEARIEQEHELDRGDHVREREQNNGGQCEQNVKKLVKQLIVVRRTRLDVVHFL